MGLVCENFSILWVTQVLSLIWHGPCLWKLQHLMSHSSVVFKLTWTMSVKASASYESGTVVLKSAWHQKTAMEHLRFGVMPPTVNSWIHESFRPYNYSWDGSFESRAVGSVRLQRAGCHTVQPSSTCWLPHGTAVFNVLPHGTALSDRN